MGGGAGAGPGAGAGGGGGAGSDAAAEDHTGQQVCGNCGAWVPSMSIARHDAFCRKNVKRCEYPGCGKALRVSEPDAHAHCTSCDVVGSRAAVDKHVAVRHTSLPCVFRCGTSMHLQPLLVHSLRECNDRMIVCRYCGATVRVRWPVASAVFVVVLRWCFLFWWLRCDAGCCPGWRATA